MSEIADRVKQIIVNYLSVDKDAVSDNATFADLGADSLDTVDIIMAFEKEFDIKIPEDQSDKIATVGDAIKFVEAEVAKK
ncbi:MAG: acyl carrier protein [Bacteroidales bacterium]|nr:acyl carrier protein [Bacteroidales bacterium]MCD8386877.1 acyl carrier protein [Bacteroidales bacterium]